MKGLIRAVLLPAGLVFSVLGFAGSASAAVILSPISAIVESGGAQADIENTFNQAGLSAGFLSTVENFDTYIAGNPTHSQDSANEWFSTQNATSASVLYNLGDVFNLSAFALWNEDFAGIPSFNLSVSADGVNYTSVLPGQTPTNNTFNQPYLADVFGFAEIAAQFVRLEMLGCAGNTAGSGFCAVGEVAFRGTPIAEPGVLALTGVGLFALGLVLRRRNRVVA